MLAAHYASPFLQFPEYARQRDTSRAVPADRVAELFNVAEKFSGEVGRRVVDGDAVEPVTQSALMTTRRVK